MTETGNASSAASQKIIGDTRAEIAVKRELLAAQNANLIAAQAERQSAIRAAQAELAAAEAALQHAKDQMAVGGRAAIPIVSQGGVAAFEESLRAARETAAQLNADAFSAQQVIEENGRLLSSSFIDAELAAGGVLAGAKGIAEWLGAAWTNADGIASTNMAGAISPAESAAARLVGYLSQAWAWVSSLAGIGTPSVTTGPGGMEDDARGRRVNGPLTVTSSVRPRSAPFELGVPDIPAASGGGGGGSSGGGSSKANADLEEALRIIEGTLSAQEKQAKELAEMIGLRDRLIATYGLESDIVQQMDAAIAKTKNEMSGLTAVTESFFSTLSDHISSSIEDWKGWGDFVRSTLASLVSEWGPDFFTALFTPGADSGSSPGTTLGNALTGALVGSSSGGASASRVSLSQGAVALPAGRSGASGMTVVMHNDFRGADSSMKADIEGKLAQMERSFEGKVYQAIDRGRRNRRL